jgi:D-threo-aldose 1-dehydrogenase
MTIPDLRSILTSSRIGFGSGVIGHLYAAVDDSQAADALDAAWSAGVRYFDTAPLYGNGLAERRVGRLLADKDRAAFVISSKVGRSIRTGASVDESPPRDYSATGVRRSVEGSLQRLGVDRLDIALVHDPDDHWSQARNQAIPELVRMRDEGIVRNIGVGMNQVEMLHRFVVESDVDCVLVAGRYTLLDQRAADTLFPACLERGVDVIVGGVFNSGILADPDRSPFFDYELASPDMLERARELQSVCVGHGVSLPAVAIAFVLAHPAVTTAVLGARSRHEVDENVRLANCEIPDALWQEIATTMVTPATY